MKVGFSLSWYPNDIKFVFALFLVSVIIAVITLVSSSSEILTLNALAILSASTLKAFANLLVNSRMSESILTVSLKSVAIGLFTSYIVKCNIEYLKYAMLYIYSLVILIFGCHFVIDLIAFTASDIKSMYSVSLLLLVLIGNILGGILPNAINSKSVIYNDN